MKLAINGGKPVRTKEFPEQETIGLEEFKAMGRVYDHTRLSHYRGNWSESFYGGPEIQKLEAEWMEKFGSLHAVPTNSCTSALQIACGAIGLKPGDEVIVTPWSMTCSATAPLMWGAVPVFADIEEDYFCLDPESVKRKINKKTKAIIAVDLFGQPYDVPAINQIARAHNLSIIEDAAQAIGSKGHKSYAGLFGDFGCYSFTQGKHLTSGEGGMLVTQRHGLALEARMLMNHKEAVENDIFDQVGTRSVPYNDNPHNGAGFNMRLTELQAAIVSEQLKKLDRFVDMRTNNIFELNLGLDIIPAIELTHTRELCTHSFYAQAFKWDSKQAGGLHRDVYINAVKAELAGEVGRLDKGVPIGNGYIKPIHLMPLFQEKRHWVLKKYIREYKKGSCPVAERLWKDELFLSMYHALPLTDQDRADIIEAFCKVWQLKEELL